MLSVYDEDQFTRFLFCFFLILFYNSGTVAQQAN